jgi:hypothetical protein
MRRRPRKKPAAEDQAPLHVTALDLARPRPDVGGDCHAEATSMSRNDFRAGLGRKQMGVVYHTDICGTITAAIDEPTPVPSAATMLRDILAIYLR